MTDAAYAAAFRPVLDRVYTGLRGASIPRLRAVYERFGVDRGFESSFYFGLLARPMPAGALAAALTYAGVDMTAELEQGVATVDAEGTWELTVTGRELALAVQQAVAEGAEELWAKSPIATMPGLDIVPRLSELVGRLLEHGAASGGPAFAAVAPVGEPDGASPCLCLTSRLGALRHHRGDAHRAAWQGRGLSLDELRALPEDGAVRREIEAETNDRDGAIYQALNPDEKLELLAGLGALPG